MHVAEVTAHDKCVRLLITVQTSTKNIDPVLKRHWSGPNDSNLIPKPILVVFRLVIRHRKSSLVNNIVTGNAIVLARLRSQDTQ